MTHPLPRGQRFLLSPTYCRKLPGTRGCDAMVRGGQVFGMLMLLLFMTFSGNVEATARRSNRNPPAKELSLAVKDKGTGSRTNNNKQASKRAHRYVCALDCLVVLAGNWRACRINVVA